MIYRIFRSPEYCNRYEYIPIQLDKPITTPGAGVAQRKNDNQFTINDRSSYQFYDRYQFLIIAYLFTSYFD